MSKWFYLIAAALVVAALATVYTWGYRDGKQTVQDQVLTDNNNQLSDLIDKVGSVDSKLNEQAVAQEALKALISAKQAYTVKEVIKYAQRPDANVVCLDADWVRAYNSSLPSTRTGDSSTSKPDGSTGTTNSNARQSK